MSVNEDNANEVQNNTDQNLNANNSKASLVKEENEKPILHKKPSLRVTFYTIISCK